MRFFSRRTLVVGVLSVAANLGGTPTTAQAPVIQNSSTFALTEITTSLPGTVINGPVGQGPSGSGEPQDAIFTDIVRVEDGTQRFLATTLGGNVHVLDVNGQIQTSVANPLLNAAQTGNSAIFNNRFGLNSIALHPDFSTPNTFGFGKAYGVASQEVVGAVAADFNTFGTAHDSVLFEYDLSDIVGNANQVSLTNPASAPRELLRLRQPGGSHNGFDLAFRSDGQLYYSVGDGTAAPLVQDSGQRLQLAQDLDSAYGKLLRINPDPAAFTAENGLGRVSDNGQYSIAGDNPYFNATARSGEAALSEIYANGFRSPFRIDINPDNEDEVFLGDVGAGAREEINRVVAGGNYGWGIREGSIAAGNGGFLTVVTDGSTDLIEPEFEYSRAGIPGTAAGQPGGGVAVIGGFVYQGDLFDGLQGNYIGAEIGNFFSSGSASRVFFGTPDNDLFNASQEPTAFQISPNSDSFDNTTLGQRGLPNLITGLVEGFNGEIFVIGLDGTAAPGVDEGPGEFNPGNLIVARLTPDLTVGPQPPPAGTVVLIGGADSGGLLTNGDFEDLSGATLSSGEQGNSDADQFNGVVNFAGPVITIPDFQVVRSVGHTTGNAAFGLDNSAGTPLLAGGSNTGVFFNNGGVTVEADTFDAGFLIEVGSVFTLSFDIASDEANDEIFYQTTLEVGGVTLLPDSTELTDLNGLPSEIGSVDENGVIFLAQGENDVIATVTQTFTVTEELLNSLVDLSILFSESDLALTSGGGVDRGNLDNVSLLFLAPVLQGDFNDDGVVDAADYTVWRDNFGGDEATLNGAGTGDGLVDEDDFQLFVDNFGSSDTPVVDPQAVPEPASLVVVSLAAGALLAVRRRR